VIDSPVADIPASSESTVVVAVAAAAAAAPSPAPRTVCVPAAPAPLTSDRIHARCAHLTEPFSGPPLNRRLTLLAIVALHRSNTRRILVFQCRTRCSLHRDRRIGLECGPVVPNKSVKLRHLFQHLLLQYQPLYDPYFPLVGSGAGMLPGRDGIMDGNRTFGFLSSRSVKPSFDTKPSSPARE